MEDRVTPSESSQPAPNNLPPAAPQTLPTTPLLLKHPAAPQAPRRSPNFAHHPAAPQAPRCSSSTPLLPKLSIPLPGCNLKFPDPPLLQSAATAVRVSERKTGSPPESKLGKQALWVSEGFYYLWVSEGEGFYYLWVSEGFYYLWVSEGEGFYYLWVSEGFYNLFLVNGSRYGAGGFEPAAQLKFPCLSYRNSGSLHLIDLGFEAADYRNLYAPGSKPPIPEPVLGPAPSLYVIQITATSTLQAPNPQTRAASYPESYPEPLCLEYTFPVMSHPLPTSQYNPPKDSSRNDPDEGLKRTKARRKMYAAHNDENKRHGLKC
ncbi:hypothetical protein FN846DRAFT_896542 [Sphaerosporella brunnea]|uniref:Uncharacterized protein n=1 Tax=Sphaerosporella brunnea TaxID=1250544 RepID=A0A5J5EBD6_9PEZI|nr:hypothetical protein FN846DRAFT_896542 [Sphaerosporella brunnea]